MKIRLALFGSLLGANLWLAGSYLGPIRSLDPPDFVLHSRPLYELPLWMAVCVAALFVIDRRSTLGEVDLSPLWFLALPLAAVGLLLTPMRRFAGPWLFLFVDGRWWFLLGVGVLQALAVDRDGRVRLRASAAWSRFQSRPAALLATEIALAVVLGAAALAFSPPGRFTADLIGDEPKYVRFMENWYRGNGFDVAELPPISALAGDAHARVLRNAGLLIRELPTLASDLLADARRAIGLPAPPHVGPAKSDGGWFVDGKRGGVYQVHNPGFSALLFPAYVVDRYFLNWAPVESQFPPTLYATNVLLIAIYLLWAVALYRLILAYTGRMALSWVLSAVVMSSLPAVAFHYQFYPEAGAGLAITVLAYYVIFSGDPRPRIALAFGLLAGFLPWMHLRFGLAGVAAAVAFAVVRRDQPRAVIYFSGGFAVALGALGLYYYHIAGSPLPWTLYDVVPESPGFSGSRMLYGMPRFLYDWRGGILAHSPVFLLALAGLLLFMRRPRASGLIAAQVLAVAAVAAAHNWHGAGTSPSRLIAAVVPLLALPLADALVRWSRSRLFIAAFVLLAAVSIANGLIFSRHFERIDQVLHAETTGGWMTPLLMPIGDDAEDRMLVVWWMITAALLALPVFPRIHRRTIPLSWTRAAAGAVLIFLVAAAAASAYHAETFGERFAADDQAVGRQLIAAHLNHPSGLTWTARRGRVKPEELFPTTVQEAAAAPARQPAGSGVPAVARPVDPGGALRGLPDSLVAQPVGLTIESLRVDGAQIEMRCAAIGDLRVQADDSFWIWMIGGDIGRARLHTVRPSAIDDGGARLTLSFTPEPAPRDQEYLRLVAGGTATRPGQRAPRTRVVRLYWPGAHLTAGSPVVLDGMELP